MIRYLKDNEEQRELLKDIIETEFETRNKVLLFDLNNFRSAGTSIDDAINGLKEERAEDELLMLVGNNGELSSINNPHIDIFDTNVNGLSSYRAKNGTVPLVSNTAFYDGYNNCIIMPNDLISTSMKKRSLKLYIEEVLDEAYKYINMSKEEFSKIESELNLKETVNSMYKYVESNQNNLENELNHVQSSIRRIKQELLNVLTRREQLIKDIATAREKHESIEEMLIKEFQLIQQLPKVESFHMMGSILYVQLKELIAYTVDGKSAIKIPRIELRINMQTSEIIFWGKEQDKVRGFWYSVHPHVDNRGEACLGNIDATIVELISQREILALITVLVNFLESVNQEDVAGESYHNWVQVDVETGEELENQLFRCELCQDQVEEEEIVICTDCDRKVCMDCVTYLEGRDEYVCNSCIDYNYTLCSVCNEYENDEDAHYCQECNEYVCDHCFSVGNENRAGMCVDCLEKWEDKDNEEQEDESDEIPENELMTCEVCGKQGTDQEIRYRSNEMFMCSDCYGGIV